MFSPVLQQSQSAVNTALQEVSTGKSVNVPSDNPAASADMVQNTIETSDVDQYTQNASSVLSMVQTADSTLSSVVSSLTKAVSLGTEGANGTMSAAESTGDRHRSARDTYPVLSRWRTPRIKDPICSVGRRAHRHLILPTRVQLPATATTAITE